MFPRKIELYLESLAGKYRLITLLGPRQSGKTTLARHYFKGYEYISFEDPDTRSRAEQDPRGFIAQMKCRAIIDEVQRFPDFISYLQGEVDKKDPEQRWVLTGSNSLLLSNKISQSLAGRSRTLYILPLQRSEIPAPMQPQTINAALIYGNYPRVYDEGLQPTEWYGDYFQTYVEKDVRNLTNINNLNSFDRFVRLLAGRVGQLFNSASIGNDTGISAPTAKSWLNLLEASFIAFTLRPHFKNFSKRLIKSPKIYFYDTGLVCYLLRIRDVEQLNHHPLRGAIFENWVISEYIKQAYNRGKDPDLYFWRDQTGHEIDLVIDKGLYLDLIEIKSSQTFNPSFCQNIDWLNKLQHHKGGQIVYGGEQVFSMKDIQVTSWNQLAD